ncbi:hypothetical protein [Dyella sedimenti]|uniref:hypothetical protein n=1 Tax=Dyella sedimenti TaxID=2919947 RepID=UPI001FAA9108|nr:hypothetical protein [Dyella sedimenti]
MTVSKGWVMGLAGAAALLGAGLVLADSGEDALAKQRQAYVKAVGRVVEGIPSTATVTSLDPLGEHRIALYTVDGPHKDIWLVTTDEGCPAPVPATDRIVSYNANHQAQPCRVVRIQAVDQQQLALGLRLAHARPNMPSAAEPVPPDYLRLGAEFQAAALTDNGRTR